MKQLNDCRLGTLAFDGITASGCIDHLGFSVDVSVWVAKEEVDTLPAETDLLARNPQRVLRRAARAARNRLWPDVRLYLEHHLDEFGKDQLTALLGTDRPHAPRFLVRHLRPLALHISIPRDGPMFSVDVGLGFELTDCVLSVGFHRFGVVCVAMES